MTQFLPSKKMQKPFAVYLPKLSTEPIQTGEGQSDNEYLLRSLHVVTI